MAAVHATSRASTVVWWSEEVVVDGMAADEFTDFMLSRWAELVRFGYGLTGDQQLAEDLAQTALTRTYTSWSRVRCAADPDAYVRRIMINSNRSRFRGRRVPEHLTDSPPDHPGYDLVGGPDERTEVMTALMSLPVGQRAVVVLRYWMDLSEADTAATLGCSIGNVKSQAARALAKLRVSTELMNGGLPC